MPARTLPYLAVPLSWGFAHSDALPYHPVMRGFVSPGRRPGRSRHGRSGRRQEIGVGLDAAGEDLQLDVPVGIDGDDPGDLREDTRGDVGGNRPC
jgi:hypothetical protein